MQCAVRHCHLSYVHVLGNRYRVPLSILDAQASASYLCNAHLPCWHDHAAMTRTIKQIALSMVVHVKCIRLFLCSSNEQATARQKLLLGKQRLSHRFKAHEDVRKWKDRASGASAPVFANRFGVYGTVSLCEDIDSGSPEGLPHQ